MKSFLNFAKKAWQTLVVPIVVLFLVISIFIDFGPPSPVKVLLRLTMLVLVTANLVTVYPRQLARLFGLESSLSKNAQRTEKPSKQFYLYIIIILLLALLFNLYHITKFLTADEPKWLVRRIPNFFAQLFSFNWQQLLLSDKPGVTVAWLAESGLIFTAKEGVEKFLGDPSLLFLARLPLVLANLGLLFWLTLLVRKVVNSEFAAILFLILTATNPTIRGMTAIVNPDSISWFFPLGFLLSYLLYLKEKHWPYLLQAALIFSLGILTKFTTLIIIPFVSLLIPICFLFADFNYPGFLKEASKAFFRIFVLSWFFSLIIWPFLIVAPEKFFYFTFLKPLLRKVLFPAVFLLLVYYLGHRKIEPLLNKYKNSLKQVLFILLPLLFIIVTLLTIRLIPYLPSVPKGTKVQASLFALVVNNFFNHMYAQLTLTLGFYFLALLFIFIYAIKKHFSFFFLLAQLSLLFILMFLLGSAATKHQASIRYQIAVFPFVSLLIIATFPALAEFKNKVKHLFLAALIGINFSLLIPVAPYYLLYYNYLLPPGKLVFDGWGLGGFEAAAYLNKKQNAKSLRVYASYEGFRQFFVGKTLKYSDNPFRQPVDYLVIFKQGEKKIIIGNNLEKNAYWRYQAPAEFQIKVNQVPVVKVIKYKKHRD